MTVSSRSIKPLHMTFGCSFTSMGIWCMVVMLLAACATTPQHEPGASATAVAIGPYASFSGRLIVIEPTKRWQVLISWQAEKPDHGHLRITHAATGTVVELRWQDEAMQVRDNREPLWRGIGLAELSQHGIVIAPQTLASILLGHMPEHFKQTNKQRWESRESGHLIRLRWQQQAHRLTMTDMKYGRKAMLIIQP